MLFAVRRPGLPGTWLGAVCPELHPAAALVRHQAQLRIGRLGGRVEALVAGLVFQAQMQWVESQRTPYVCGHRLFPFRGRSLALFPSPAAQQLDQIGVAVALRPVQRRDSGIGLGVDPGTVVEQQPGDLCMAAVGRHVQRCGTLLDPRVDVRPGGDQLAHHADVALEHDPVQQCLALLPAPFGVDAGAAGCGRSGGGRRRFGQGRGGQAGDEEQARAACALGDMHS